MAGTEAHHGQRRTKQPVERDHNPMIEQLNVAGLRVSNFDLADVEQLYHKTLKSEQNVVVFGYSLGYITLFRKYFYINFL